MKKQENQLELPKEQKTAAAQKIKDYLRENLELEIGTLQADLFVDFLNRNIGAYYYNRALGDAFSFFTEKLDDLYILMKDEE